MEYQKKICDMRAGDQVEGYYILREAAIKTSVSGKKYLNAVAADCTGTIDVKIWDYSGPIGEADAGRIAKLRGEVSDYKGSLQYIVGRIRMADERDEYDVSLLLPTAPIDEDAAWKEILGYVDSMQDADYQSVCMAMMEKHGAVFRRIPAGKSVHHSFLHGLLMHTANMLKLADFLAGLYADVIDRDLLLTGTLLHDMAKEREFEFSELGMVTEYSPAGQLLGHLTMGAEEVGAAARELGLPEEKIMLLQHMLLSHHGTPEFGAAVRPAIAESELLSSIDLLDSRMEIYSETLPDVTPGTFSGKIYALDKRIYRHK